MKAFEYKLSDNEIIESRQGDVICEREDILMLYPNYMYDGDPENLCSIVNIKSTDGYGNKTYTQIIEDPDNDEWFIYIFTHDTRGNVSEWEYTSNGGYNPIMYLNSYYINGVSQEVLYRVR